MAIHTIQLDTQGENSPESLTHLHELQDTDTPFGSADTVLAPFAGGACVMMAQDPATGEVWCIFNDQPGEAGQPVGVARFLPAAATPHADFMTQVAVHSLLTAAGQINEAHAAKVEAEKIVREASGGR